MDKSMLHDIIQREQPNICQISAFRGGTEAYSDEWNRFDKSGCVHVMSVTKSIVSLLIGIAIDKGLIGGIGDKVLDYFPGYEVKRGEKTIYDVTIKHLLTMTAPYKCKGDPWTKVCVSGDWTRASLDLLGGRKGVTNEFNYQTVCLHILTGLLKSVSGRAPVDLANEFLFEPIGVHRHFDFTADTAEKHKRFITDKSPKDNVWFCDPLGVGTAGYGLCFAAEDMAKIGELCLDRGAHNGAQVVSSAWIDAMSSAASRAGKELGGMSYGCLWWIINEEKHVYAALGNSGNAIYIDPENGLAIAVSAYFKPAVRDRIRFIEETLKPYIMSL